MKLGQLKSESPSILLQETALGCYNGSLYSLPGPLSKWNHEKASSSELADRPLGFYV